MKTLSTLFLSICFAMTMAACGGGSTEAEGVDSQNDTTTTGDEMATEPTEEMPADDGAMDDGAMDDGTGTGADDTAAEGEGEAY